METKEYTTIDKSTWNRGPWDREPDKKQWLDETTGLPCLIVRNPGGALCGYVGVFRDHPFYEVNHSTSWTNENAYSKCPQSRISVHGGLTFSSKCYPHALENWQNWRKRMLSDEYKSEREKYPNGDAARNWEEVGHLIYDYDSWVTHIQTSSLCHVVDEGEDDDVWWFGFDCAHSEDFSPVFDSEFGRAFDQLLPPAFAPLRNKMPNKSCYKDLPYVTKEVESLAKQLREIEHTESLAEEFKEIEA